MPKSSKRKGVDDASIAMAMAMAIPESPKRQNSDADYGNDSNDCDASGSANQPDSDAHVAVSPRRSQLSWERNLITKRLPHDILCGRGLPIQNFYGNLRMHSIVDTHRQTYARSTKKYKKVIIDQIVREVKKDGARFLKQWSGDVNNDANVSDTGNDNVKQFQSKPKSKSKCKKVYWIEMDDRYAHQKVSHALRCKHRKNEAEDIRSTPQVQEIQEVQLPPIFGHQVEEHSRVDGTINVSTAGLSLPFASLSNVRTLNDHGTFNGAIGIGSTGYVRGSTRGYARGNGQDEELAKNQVKNRASRQAKHQESGESGSCVRKRNQQDVLCGRGLPIQNYYGNLRMHSIVDSHRREYAGSSKLEKRAIIEHVVKEIKKGGARFLKQWKGSGYNKTSNEVYWVEMDDTYAYEKVGHALRCKYRRNEAEDIRQIPKLHATVVEGQRGTSKIDKSKCL